MSHNDEKTIIARLKSNDQTAMQWLFERYYQAVCNRIFRIIKDKSTVEDIAQEVFIKFWEKRQQISIQNSLNAYLQRMAYNETISYLRKHKKHWHDELASYDSADKDTSEKTLLYNELSNKITNAINMLPNRCRIIFQLSRFEELTYKEIASQLDISVKTVENQMGKALKLMRENMKSYID